MRSVVMLLAPAALLLAAGGAIDAGRPVTGAAALLSASWCVWVLRVLGGGGGER